MSPSSWLDHLAVPTLQVDGRQVSTWRVTAAFGFAAGVAVLSLSAARAGLSPLPALSLVPFLLALCLGWVWLRRRWTGQETWVLYEHLALLGAGLLGLCTILGFPVVSVFDVYWPAVAVLFAFGRLGCTAVGCCHGVPCSVGVRYGTGPRRAAVQLVEAAAWLVLAVAGFLSLGAAPGLVSGAGLLAYAVIRWTLEGWRGDVRPSWRGLSIGRWGSLGAGLVGVGVLTSGGASPDAMTGVAALAVLVLAGGRRRWLEPSPVTPPVAPPARADVLRVFALRLLAERPNQPVLVRVREHQVAGSWMAAEQTWALSCSGGDAEEAASLLVDLAGCLRVPPGVVQRSSAGVSLMVAPVGVGTGPTVTAADATPDADYFGGLLGGGGS